MSEYDDDGYFLNIPIKPDQWKLKIPDKPSGLIITSNSVPPGFFIVQNFLDHKLCDEIVRESDFQSGAQHTISGDVSIANTRSSETRTSEFIDTRLLRTDITGIVRQTFLNAVGPHYRQQIDWFELPEILRYKSGGEYKPHADADNWFPQDRQWRRVIDRDLSILIYLNEGYTGGEIDFPNFGLRLQPKKGLLIAFPSDARYVHAARPVTAGVRYALVSWATVKGGPRINLEPRPHIIRL